MMTYGFEDQLAMSHGVSVGASVGDILRTNIPGAINAEKACEKDDRNGTDWWVNLLSGRKISVDCKVRSKDYALVGKDDLALETYSVFEIGIEGWTRDRKKQTDYILWLWQDTGRWCLIPFLMLCQVFREKWEQWSEDYETAQQRTERRNGNSYRSECVFVPRHEVWRAIYERFGGSPITCGGGHA